MPIAGTRIPINTAEGMDKISQTEKVTSPYFSNGSATLAAASIKSSSLSDTNETYFFGISNSSTLTTEEFNVAFGSTNGYGGQTSGGTIKSPTEAIYKQYASMLLAPLEVTGGFKISQNGSHAGKISTKDTEIFIMNARRSNMKDRINKGTWTVAFSGSAGDLSGVVLKLTDDSKTQKPTATPAGDRYNIVSGSAGTAHNAATSQSFGFFYPSMGILVLSGHELSASMPGRIDAGVNNTVIFDSGSQKGFGFAKTTTGNTKQALRLINCLLESPASLTFRDEEDQVSAQYFCRTRAGHMNFSNNPTFVSGSLNELRQEKMKGNPNTFITSVQLYNDAGDMVAVGNLSTPLKKNFTSEATIKVKLTY